MSADGLGWVQGKTGKAHDEQISSAPPPTADIVGRAWQVSSVPTADLARQSNSLSAWRQDAAAARRTVGRLCTLRSRQN